jgi:hypothetical protein
VSGSTRDPRRALLVRITWFGAGWVVAGLLEWAHIAVWWDIAVLFVALFAAAGAADREDVRLARVDFTERHPRRD